MAIFQPVGAASDRVMATLITGLEIEFGRGASEGLARHFLDAEGADFRWEARAEERWLGGYEGGDEEDFWLDRVAICGRLDGRWFAATMTSMATATRTGCSDAANSEANGPHARR